MRKYAFLFLATLCLFAGCKGKDKSRFTEEELAQIPLVQTEGLPKVSGGIVLSVTGETITSDRIATTLTEAFRPLAQRSKFEQFSKTVRPEVEKFIASRVSDILLYNEAKAQAGDNVEDALEKAVETEIRKFINLFGGDYAKAEQTLKQDGMDWASFRKYQKRMILSQSYIASQIPDEKTVTYSELLERYEQMKEEFFTVPATLTFSLIDIQPYKVNVSDPNQNQRAAARDLANELRTRLDLGEDFSKLAKQYSHGHRATMGGLWKPVGPDSLAKPYDVLSAEAAKIKAGEIAGPIVTDEHMFIMKLQDKQPATVKALDEVQAQIKASIVIERRMQALDKLSAKLLRQAAVGQREQFIELCLEQLYLRCTQ
ncbi:MAG: peptidyl-prolyl cis-trans isomerase [Sedimentisphaerales bacterium]|nr:peptidyl-prolyl cis-trans isomerase [Sedimentisphaerales bacterium]